MAINIKKGKEISEANEKNLKLQEDCSKQIAELKDSIKKIFNFLIQYGLEYNIKDLHEDLDKAKELRSDYRTYQFAGSLGGKLDPVFHEIRTLEFDRALEMARAYKATKTTNPKDLAFFLNEEKLAQVERKYSEDIYSLSKIDRKLYSEIENFKKIYSDIKERSEKNKHAINPKMADEAWAKQADDIVSSITNFFSQIYKESVTDNTQSNKPEKKSSSWFSSWFEKSETTPEAQEAKPEKTKFSISFASQKWYAAFFNKTHTEQKVDPNTQKVEQESELKPTNINLSSDNVTKNIDAYYSALGIYVYTAAKGSCFASAIANIQKISNECAIKRTQKVANTFNTANQESDPTEQTSSDGKSVVLVKAESSKAVITTNNEATFESLSTEKCQALTEQYYTLAENCNFIFSEETIIDEGIENALIRAATVNINVNDKAELLLMDQHGFEAHMTYQTKEYTEANFLNSLSCYSSDQSLLGYSETSDNTKD